MAYKKIVKIWDDLVICKSNIDFLTSKTNVVKFPLTKYDKKIIKDLKDTADRIDCAGIAANQIGHNKRIFIGYSDNSLESYKIYINPLIILKYQNSIVPGYKNEIDHYNREDYENHIYEGCLSLPNAEFSFPRYHKIKVQYQTEDGKNCTETLEQFHSQIFQHELDHLDGKTIAHRCIESIKNRKEGTIILVGYKEKSREQLQKKIKTLHNNFQYLKDYFKR